MSYEVITTSNFEKDVKRLRKKYRDITNDILRFSADIETSIASGEPLGKHCHKVRIKITGKNSGKSGGGRIILQAKIVQQKVFLLALYDKAERGSISETEIDRLISAI